MHCKLFTMKILQYLTDFMFFGHMGVPLNIQSETKWKYRIILNIHREGFWDISISKSIDFIEWLFSFEIGDFFFKKASNCTLKDNWRLCFMNLYFYLTEIISV